MFKRNWIGHKTIQVTDLFVASDMCNSDPKKMSDTWKEIQLTPIKGTPN